jgi:hypothetical protein
MTCRLLSVLTALSLLLLARAARPAFGSDAPATAQHPLAKLPGPSGTAVEFSRYGKLILTAGSDEARVWDAETFKPVTGPLSQRRASESPRQPRRRPA